MVISKIPFGYQISLITPDEAPIMAYLMEALQAHPGNRFTWEDEIKALQDSDATENAATTNQGSPRP